VPVSLRRRRYEEVEALADEIEDRQIESSPLLIRDRCALSTDNARTAGEWESTLRRRDAELLNGSSGTPITCILHGINIKDRKWLRFAKFSIWCRSPRLGAIHMVSKLSRGGNLIFEDPQVTTTKQAAANRRNAKLSTGPATEKGRERTKMNALKHGLSAKTVIVSAERAKDYEVFRDAMFEDRAPVGALECLLVERIVVCAWRLRRAVRKEADLDRRERVREENAAEYIARPGSTDSIHGLVAFGSVETDDLVDAQADLLRYETAIERGLYRAIHNLERVQARRLGQHVAAPIAVDFGRDAKADMP
jgi:hypothetical protein